MAIALPDIVHAKNVDLGLRTRTRENTLRHLIGLLAANEQVAEPDKFLEKVLEREQTNPSVVEHGIVFPHARTDVVSEIVLAAGRSRAGVPFVAEGERARLVFLIGVPQRLVSDYLVVIGTLARLTKDDVVRSRLLIAATPEEFVAILNDPSNTI